MPLSILLPFPVFDEVEEIMEFLQKKLGLCNLCLRLTQWLEDKHVKILKRYSHSARLFDFYITLTYSLTID